MINRLIRGAIIEIIITLMFVGASIPIWNSFLKKVSAANITTLDDLNLDFNIATYNNNDTIEVNNSYYINKNYKINLIVNKDINAEKSKVKINNIEYKLIDFECEKRNNKYIYTLINDYINASSETYKISPIIIGDANDYSYLFEEKSLY